MLTSATQTDPVKLDLVVSLDSVELYTANAEETARFLQTRVGLERFRGPASHDETLVLRSGQARVLITGASASGAVAAHVLRHGDTIRDVAFEVHDAQAAFDRAMRNGAVAVQLPQTEAGGVKRAVVAGPGELVHSLVQRPQTQPDTGGLFRSIDHVALAVPAGELDKWVGYYIGAFGFQITHEEMTTTEHSGMRSIVVENAARNVRFPILEPVPGRNRSQVEDFLMHHDGAGVQHLALLCDDIFTASRRLRSAGLRFLHVPDQYYGALPARIGELNDSLDALRELRLLVDRDEWGVLIQSFSKPIVNRPTLFLELVQRNGARGFGGGNIRALFEAVEREQAARDGGGW